MTAKEAAKLIAVAVAALPNIQGKSLAATADAWAAIMPDVSFDDGKAAMLLVLREKTIPTLPLPGEILAALKKLHDPDGLPTAAEAWGEVMELARKRGIYTPWAYSNALVQKAVACFGREELCALQTEQVPTARAQFLRIYDSMAQKEKDKKANEEIFKLMPTRPKAKVAALIEQMEVGEARNGSNEEAVAADASAIGDERDKQRPSASGDRRSNRDAGGNLKRRFEEVKNRLLAASEI